jgi:hypothetical protein
MTKHRDFNPGVPFPSASMDALYEYISTYVSSNFTLTSPSPSSFTINAGTGNDQVAIGIQGQLCYVTSPVGATVPNSTGTFNLYAVASPLVESSEDSGTWNYAFTLTVAASPPGGVKSRLLGTVSVASGLIGTFTPAQSIVVSNYRIAPDSISQREIAPGGVGPSELQYPAERVLAKGSWNVHYQETPANTSTMVYQATFTNTRPNVRVEAYWPFIRDVRGGAGLASGGFEMDGGLATYPCAVDISGGAMGVMQGYQDYTLSIGSHTFRLYTAVGNSPVTAQENGTGIVKIIQT